MILLNKNHAQLHIFDFLTSKLTSYDSNPSEQNDSCAIQRH